jgi:hypothetical protein
MGKNSRFNDSREGRMKRVLGGDLTRENERGRYLVEIEAERRERSRESWWIREEVESAIETYLREVLHYGGEASQQGLLLRSKSEAVAGSGGASLRRHFFKWFDGLRSVSFA